MLTFYKPQILLQPNYNLSSVKFISPTLLAYGGEDKNVTVIDVETEAKQILTGHQSRIKSLDFVK